MSADSDVVAIGTSGMTVDEDRKSDVCSSEHLAYRPGVDLIHQVWRQGVCTRGARHER